MLTCTDEEEEDEEDEEDVEEEDEEDGMVVAAPWAGTTPKVAAVLFVSFSSCNEDQY